MLTDSGTIDNAVHAMQAGAAHYLTKPCTRVALEAAILQAHEQRQKALLHQELLSKAHGDALIGESSPCQTIREIINKVAPTNATVLIQGESGVGKKHLARWIHQHSARRVHPFIALDCTAWPPPWLQYVLFGQERGMINGALAQKPGLLEAAHHGTLFLAEISALSPAIQRLLLRVLETGQFRRMGGLKPVTVDVRIIAATTQPLAPLVAAGTFQEDLDFRLNLITILVPSLRDRTADIPLLISHFLEQRPLRGKRKRRISPAAMALLQAYSWPGNVRELRNVLECAVMLSTGEEITVRDLPADLWSKSVRFPGGAWRTLSLKALKERYRTYEQQHLATLLRKYAGYRAPVARILQISERTLYRKIREYHLE
jgi:two-component system NtrC family response regulator